MSFSQRALLAFLHRMSQHGFSVESTEAARAAATLRVFRLQSTCFGSWGKGAAFSCRIVETGFMARYYPQVETSIEKAEQGPAGGSVRAHSELLNCQ